MNLADTFYITTGRRSEDVDTEIYADKMIRQDWAEAIYESGLSTADLFREIGEAIATKDEAQAGHLLCRLVRDYWMRQAELDVQLAAEREHEACSFGTVTQEEGEWLDSRERARDMQRELRRPSCGGN